MTIESEKIDHIMAAFTKSLIEEKPSILTLATLLGLVDRFLKYVIIEQAKFKLGSGAYIREQKSETEEFEIESKIYEEILGRKERT